MCPSRRFAVLTLLAMATQLAAAAENFLPNRDTPAPADQPIPAIDFVRPRLFETPQLNPAGTHFAALTKNQELKTTLLVCEIATGKIEWKGTEANSFDWTSDTRLALARQPTEALPSVEVGNLRKYVYGGSNLDKNKRGLQPGTGFLWTWPADDLPRSEGFTIQNHWFLPEDGKLGYCLVLDDTGHRKLKRFEKRKWIDCPADWEEITPIAVGTKAGEMIVLGPRAKGKPRAIQRMDVITGTLGEVIYQDPTYDCLPEVSFKRGTQEINGVRVPNSADRWIWLSQPLRETQALMRKQFPGMLVRIVSTDIRELRFIIEVQSDRQPPTYYFLDREKNSLGLLKNTAPWIDPGRMQPTQVMTYKTSDGVTIEGYLTLPAGASKDNPAPLVVDIHAGPWTDRAYWRWNDWTQFLASRGYAVFQPNYRGSLGYDSRIEPADRFGFDKMRDDISAGVKAVGKSGLIDTRRVAVEGVGFGSYLALAAVIQDPELYRCAIVFGGVYDWEKAFRKTDSKMMYDERWLQAQLHQYDRNPPAPLADSDQIKVPVFFTRNTTVWDITNEDQFREMYNALKGNTHVVNFGDLNLYREDDAYGELVTRAQQIEQFLGQHLTYR